MTQGELGQLLGVKKAAVQKWETGQVVNLKQSTISKLCKVFHRSPSVFIFDDYEDYLNVGALEIKLLRANIQAIYGKDSMEVLEKFDQLTVERKKKVLTYLLEQSILDDLTD